MNCLMEFEGHKFFWSIVYGCNIGQERRRLWEAILQIVEGMENPWIVQGDFNAILSNQERSGDAEVDSSSEDFKECIMSAALSEMRTRGCYFTWTNNQLGPARIWQKLDRCLVNMAWLDIYSS
ncbi:hypothetical protein MANES_04G060201v8 [Manihot esculenta]|nr:hypothetical protein MANES_04G060201v8 [Manihot esculenta]